MFASFFNCTNAGHLDEATAHFNHALAMSRDGLTATGAGAKADIGTATILNNYGNLRLKQKRYSSALEHYVEALEVLEMLGDRDSTEDSLSAALEAIIATVCCNVGSLLASQQRSTEAEEMVPRALEIRLRILGDSHVDTACAYYAAGQLAMKAGILDTAVEHFQKTLAIRCASAYDRLPVRMPVDFLGASVQENSAWPGA